MKKLLWRRANLRNLVTISCEFGNKNLVTNLRIVTFYKV